MKIKFYLLVLLGLVFSLTTLGQVLECRGKIIDALTEEELPFANVSITNSKLGVAANSLGDFRLQFQKENINDTVIISFIGFETQRIPVKDLKKDQVYKLNPLTETLDEFVLSPLTAEQFMKGVVNSIKDNAPSSDFSSVGYYSSRGLENGKFLSHEEVVFKSYVANFLDTAALLQHQITNYRKRKDVSEVQFMAREAEKEKKRLERKGEGSQDSTSMNIVNSLGGLDNMIELMSNEGSLFLDTNDFKKINFKFHDKPLYDEKGNEITLIHASTKGRINKVKATCKIYVDRDSYAIIKMEGKMDIRIPLLLKPVLFVMGIGIENPEIHYSKNFNKLENGKWYPDNIYVSIDLDLIKKRMFKANDKSKFKIQELYSVQNINSNNPKQLEKSKVFSNEKTLEEQVFPESNINWSSVKVIEF